MCFNPPRGDDPRGMCVFVKADAAGSVCFNPPRGDDPRGILNTSTDAGVPSSFNPPRGERGKKSGGRERCRADILAVIQAQRRPLTRKVVVRTLKAAGAGCGNGGQGTGRPDRNRGTGESPRQEGLSDARMGSANPEPVRRDVRRWCQAGQGDSVFTGQWARRAVRRALAQPQQNRTASPSATARW